MVFAAHWLTPTPAFLAHISKMYFGFWKPAEVSERMWSENLDASISGRYQTIGGHSGPALRVTEFSDNW
jgi:hypothetical protein